ncbi:DUF6825 family protein [Oscillatoria salina]|uniref:DUF6825 family protein n=1 Tax=Oscillatoria salina TaxID=331517 RepID=UPI0013BD6786|nr:hypothetical protein [Oscillatoria salina]MBZ8179078.1 hypothetical protein [Oscillatoria salina IIICB1]NET88814.1 hypothetical protein [Kamptonema sp. SIO1D9]
MSNPVIHAFFIGRAVAEIIGEKVEDSFTNALSELGKFDAEQRENLRQFTEEVIARAEREISLYDRSDPTTGTSPSPTSGLRTESSSDLQETIDELRAEIARLKSELKQYRSSLT